MRKSEAVGIVSGVLHAELYEDDATDEGWLRCHFLAVKIIEAISPQPPTRPDDRTR